jgi:flagellar basal-body rod protein FlgG
MSMHPALGIGQSGLLAQQLNLANTANDLANVNTTAYKSSKATFQDLPYQVLRQPGALVDGDARLPSGLVLGTGVRLASLEKDFTAGDRKQTDNPLNVMIDGPGFFQIQNTDGTLSYTRDGSFSLDSVGDIVTADGLLLMPNIVVPNNTEKIMISPLGVVSVILPGSSTAQQLGTIELATFVNQGGLEPIGNNRYLQTDASGQPALNNPGTDCGVLVQGALESSNVNVVQSLVSMIEEQRAYEANAKVLEHVDQSLQFAIQVLG